MVSVAPDSAPLATPARDLQIEPPPQAPPPPSSDAATRAILAFRTAYAAKGFAGAVTLTMDCYGKLEAASSWEGWDYCASIDEIAQAANQSSQNPVDFFAANSVRARQSTAGNAIKWGAADGDRIAALKVILSQAAQEKAASEKAALEAALHQPSFDCSKVTSENLKLICSTPDLADADQLMASAYSAATFAVTDKAVLRASQREWVRRRNSEPPIVPTLLALYADRIAQLKALSLQTPTSP